MSDWRLLRIHFVVGEKSIALGAVLRTGITQLFTSTLSVCNGPDSFHFAGEAAARQAPSFDVEILKLKLNTLSSWTALSSLLYAIGGYNCTT